MPPIAQKREKRKKTFAAKKRQTSDLENISKISKIKACRSE